MICGKNEIEVMRKMNNIEVFKVLVAYLIDGISKKVSIKIEEGDNVNYIGRVDIGTEMSTITSETDRISTFLIQMDNKIKIENGMINILRIRKNSSNKYESVEHSISIPDYRKMIESIRNKIDIKKNFVTFIEHVNDNLKSLDERSEDYKCHMGYKELVKEESYLFSFIKIEFDFVDGEGSRTITRNWYVFDYNDDDFRAVKNVTDEFKILPIHIENISEIKPR